MNETQLYQPSTIRLRIRIFAGIVIFMALLLPVVISAQAAPPNNDDFDAATTLSSLPFSESLDTREATTAADDPTPSCNGGRDASVWYAYTPAADFTLVASTQGSNYDTVVSVYTGSRGVLTETACAAFQHPLSFPVTAGITYYIMVSQLGGPYPPPPGGAGGTLVFSLSEVVPPPNDLFANAETIVGLPFQTTVDNTGAMVEPDEPLWCSYANNTVWYKFTPVQPVLILVTNEPGTPGAINVYQDTGGGFAGLVSVGCTIYFGSLEVGLQAGVTYYIQLGSYSNPGLISMSVSEIILAPPPPNDHFGNARVVNALPFSDSVEADSATIEDGEPQNCNYMYQTTWYAFTPAVDLSIQASAGGSEIWSVQLAAYQATGPGLADLIFLGCNSSPYAPLGLYLQAGTTYYFQAGSTRPNYRGYIAINLQVIYPPANDLFANAAPIESLPFSVEVDISQAITETNELSPCNTYNTVWYSFTPGNDMNVEFSLPQYWDAHAAIYQAGGPGITDLSFLGCAYNENFALNAQAGVTYYLQVGRDYWSSITSVQVDVHELLPPANDAFANAEVISGLPFMTNVDLRLATIEDGEPSPTCATTYWTVWYAFTPAATTRLTVRAMDIRSIIAVYTGSDLASLVEVGCSPGNTQLPMLLEADTTYYFQVGIWNLDFPVPIDFQLYETPPPVASFYWYPYDPNTFEVVVFCDNSYDPSYSSFISFGWDFGEGFFTTTDYCVYIRFPQDGDYPILHRVETADGRSAETTYIVQVRTHDVEITRFKTPNNGRVGQTAKLVIAVSSQSYAELVTLELWKSTPYGSEYVGTLTQNVPAGGPSSGTDFVFYYTFTSEDADVGKVNFRVVARIEYARDALPLDNESISLPTRVER